MARINNLTNFLTDVATAIKTKKGDNTPIPASNFDTEITNLPSGGGNENAIIDFGLIGKTGTNSKYINYAITKVPNFDATDYTSFKDMFKNCSNLENVVITNTSSVVDMSGMFSGCYELITIPSLDTSSATNMSSMFNGCSKLTTISGLDTSSATNTSNMFNNCYELTTIPVFDLGKVVTGTNMRYMFSGCRKLNTTSLDNILQSCISATSYTGTKTLYYLGLRNNYYPTSTIQSLPHYQDFINAGWTIGY